MCFWTKLTALLLLSISSIPFFEVKLICPASPCCILFWSVSEDLGLVFIDQTPVAVTSRLKALPGYSFVLPVVPRASGNLLGEKLVLFL